ncbi:MAG: LrgB family protein [Peptococcaceae bacterium]|nr:LrgB family protein [Peptococcaceae bacterium]MBQ5683094.1 LrgB family protein [Peptococcaceae bacterium]MBQ5858929.1 LrgB family protein [Peptococcaceae bacterium]
MSELLYSPYFGVIATIFAYQAGVSIQKKVKHPLANPILIAVLLICTLLVIMDIPLEAYQEGGNLIYLFLAPATAALAVPIYKNWQILRLNWKPIIAGTMAGSFSSIVIVFALCKLFKLEESLTLSLLSKSVTTPIAVGITEQLGGIVPIAIAAVIFSGITGNIMAPFLVKVFRVEDPVAQGIGIGTASHAIGTTRAITMGELQGAMSGLAIGLSGLWTVFWTFLFSVWIG